MDGSERIAEVAERLVSANGLGQSQGGPISIKQGRLEQLASLPAEKVLLVTHIGHNCAFYDGGQKPGCFKYMEYVAHR